MVKKSAKKFNINQRLASPAQQGKIRVGADNYKQDTDIGSRNFTIGYEYYNQSLCEVTLLDKSPLRKIIDNHKKFGRCSTIRDLLATGITLNPITNSNHYTKFFQGLDPDIELKEFDTGKNERAFLFIDTYKNIIQMVAYTNAHVENKKQKK